MTPETEHDHGLNPPNDGDQGCSRRPPGRTAADCRVSIPLTTGTRAAAAGAAGVAPAIRRRLNPPNDGDQGCSVLLALDIVWLTIVTMSQSP